MKSLYLDGFQVFAFFEMIVLVGLAVFLMLSAFIFKWSPTLAKYSASSESAAE